jgi:hypothetical protein
MKTTNGHCLYKKDKKKKKENHTSNAQEPCLQIALTNGTHGTLTSLKITKKKNSNHQIQQTNWPEKIILLMYAQAYSNGH